MPWQNFVPAVEAKKLLKDDERNFPKILSRIEDMKRKMPSADFEEVAKRYV